jgi:cytochrome c oxidase subunit I+III
MADLDAREAAATDRPIPDELPTAKAPPTDQELDRLWDDPPGFLGKLKAVQNDAIGRRLILTGFFFLILGGTVDSLIMRLQLAVPDNDLIGPQAYSELFTNHGSVTMFLVILPIFEGFAILLLPLLLGNREMPFPRLGAFAYWTFLLGGLLYYSSTLFNAVPDAGWFAYTPLSGPEFSPDLAIDFWVLGLGVAEVGAIAAAIEIIIGVLKMRAPGMTLSRMPLFSWAILVTAFMILFAFTPLIVGSLLLELDRGFGTQFFNPDLGGSSLLWQHLFWIFGHPEVYIQFLPATGIVSMIIPVFARKRIVGYNWIVLSLIAIGFLSFGLWAHHMFTVGLPPIVLSFFAAASMVIAIPAGIQIFAWLATAWFGKPAWRTPFMFAIGFIALFVLGGITGVMVASVPFDLQAHDSYFVVAHLHYVLIGGVAFPIFAGVYHWFPKFTGRMLDERLGRWNFWLLFVGVNVAFFPMHIVGLMGMPRRVHTYPAGLGWETYNLISTVGAFILAAGILVFVANVIYSLRRGERAGHNPWGGDSLEWALPSPPLQHTYSVPPIIRSRHPLWDQDDLHTGDKDDEDLVHALSQWPLRWRAALLTGTSDARPQEIFRVAGPSIWPLVAGIGVVTIFAAELTKVRWGAILGALVVMFGVVAWNWPEPAPISEAEELDFEAKHKIPVHVGGSLIIARWGMNLVITFIGIALASFLLTYFYLRLENPVWPPEDFSMPGLVAPALAGMLVSSGTAAMFWARKGIERGDQSRLRAGLIAASLLAAAGVGSQIIDFAGHPFSWISHAYGSVFYVVGGFAILVALAGLIMGILTIYWAFRGEYTARRHVPVSNVATFWLAMTVVWLTAQGVIHISPYLT